MLALAIFLTNSTDDEKERGATIAAITKAVYESALYSVTPDPYANPVGE